VDKSICSYIYISQVPISRIIITPQALHSSCPATISASRDHPFVITPWHQFPIDNDRRPSITIPEKVALKSSLLRKKPQDDPTKHNRHDLRHLARRPPSVTCCQPQHVLLDHRIRPTIRLHSLAPTAIQHQQILNTGPAHTHTTRLRPMGLSLRHRRQHAASNRRRGTFCPITFLPHYRYLSLYPKHQRIPVPIFHLFIPYISDPRSRLRHRSKHIETPFPSLACWAKDPDHGVGFLGEDVGYLSF
jgi:hypothetical protein